MLKPLSAPIKPDRSWVSLPTHNPRGEHQARKEQFMLAQGQGVDYDKRLVKLSSNKLELLFSQYERDIHNNPPQLGGFYSRNNKRIVLNISGE